MLRNLENEEGDVLCVIDKPLSANLSCAKTITEHSGEETQVSTDSDAWKCRFPRRCVPCLIVNSPLSPNFLDGYSLSPLQTSC